MRGRVAARRYRSNEPIKRGLTLLLLAVTVAGGLASIARADGDPASDYLIARQAFLSSLSPPESPLQRQLLSVVASANRAGFAIRVAVISSEYDLGSITALWRKPGIYARFLGLELSSTYGGRLLVVMPNGFGFSWPGHSTSSADQLLTRVPVGLDAAGLATAATTAVRQLAASAGVQLAASANARKRANARPRSRGGDRAVIIVAAAAALAAVVVLLFALGRRRRTRVPVPSEPSIANRAGSRLRLHRAVPAFGLLIIVATGAPILALTSFRHGSRASGARVGSVVTPPPFSWRAGRRPAPGFVLRDQDGRRVSIAAYRGRPVIVTFIDPLCRNLCPLEAKVLNDVVGRVPVSQRPEILAVSVDVYANARANLLRDVREWELVPQWRWAVGRPSQLAAVWKRYKVGVSVTTKRIAGNTINYIIHTEAAYIVDSTGHERALFLWPFYPQDVQRTLRQLS
jgi:cytochrome oxidase Cu insertion factor (SCO1/SenC/PrrC family)